MAFGDTLIELPEGHPLPYYKARHPRYDRFLPHLCTHLEASDVMVDVGANCGDTLAAIYSANPSLKFVCIEADQGFFELLAANAKRITSKDPRASIELVLGFVGLGVGPAKLVGSAGTRHAVSDNSPTALTPESLNALLMRCGTSHPRLIKSDVDGFDYDVIGSAASLLTDPLPLLFFECQFDDIQQRTGYDTLFVDLQNKGYVEFAIFDNFGNHLISTSSLEQLGQAFDYIGRQNQGQATRTIYYYDILTYGENDIGLVTDVLARYNKVDFSAIRLG